MATLVLTACLAAPQIAASIDWAPQSVRYAEPSPTTRDETFDFSVAPWHWLELFAPAISGNLFPQYARTSHLLAGDGRTWALTLYCGSIPLALAALRYIRLLRPLGRRRSSWQSPGDQPSVSRSLASQRIRRWLSRIDGWDCIAPLAILFAMGNLSLAVAVRWFGPQTSGGWYDFALSPYGWLVAVVPGYDGFRYPAKWLVFLPLGISIAAARQVGCLARPVLLSMTRLAIGFAAACFLVSATLVVILHAARTASPTTLQVSDSIWGPLNVGVAQWTLAVSALAIVCLAKLLDATTRFRRNPNTTRVAVMLLVTIDLWIVARPSVAAIDRLQEQALRLPIPADPQSIGPQSTEHPDRSIRPPNRALRGERQGWPSDLRTTPSPGNQRILQAEASMRNTLFGRWHLLAGIAVFNSSTSLPPGAMQSFWSAANGTSRPLAPGDHQHFWTMTRRWLAIDQTWTRRDVDAPSPSDAAATILVSKLVATATPTPEPPIAWYPTYREYPSHQQGSIDSLRRRMTEIAANESALHVPWIESASLLERAADSDNAPTASAALNLDHADTHHPAAIIVQSHPKPGHWTIEVDAPTAGLVCIRQYQDGNFRAAVRPVSQPNGTIPLVSTVHRCDHLFSAIQLPAGRFEVEVTYAPHWLWPSLLIAFTAWSTLLVTVIFRQRKTHPLAVVTSETYNGFPAR